MAPTDPKTKSKKPAEREGALNKAVNSTMGIKKKRKWVHEHKVFEGSVKEGQGFAFRRKQKVKHEYNRLLRKEKTKEGKKKPVSKELYEEEYPEHLKHLYMAEAERLRSQAWTNRVNRSKLRMKEAREETHNHKDAAAADVAMVMETETEAAAGNPEATAAAERESLPISNRMRKKLQKKTSFQKTKEELENIREKRRKKKEDFLKSKQQREEAIQKYKQKKLETFQVLSKKTKKGQPNLNLQMEFLLQKIQGSDR